VSWGARVVVAGNVFSGGKEEMCVGFGSCRHAVSASGQTYID
jgi:hypothetical protein